MLRNVRKEIDKMKKINIGIMGSAADLNYNEDTLNFAKKLGELIAKSGNNLVYGAEKEYSSLSTEAAKEASLNGGTTIGITYGKEKNVYGEFRPDILIPCGLEIGGGREFTLILSCDVIIAISGGSGTLTEMAIAYQANKPIITVNCFGGWAEKLSDKYIDDRKRVKCIGVDTPEKALKAAIDAVSKEQV